MIATRYFQGRIDFCTLHQSTPDFAVNAPSNTGDGNAKLANGDADRPLVWGRVGERGTFTYRELNARANQLAHHLRSLGIEAGTLVAVCMERSPALIVGILSILKAGGAYLPLEPTYPQERLAFMVEDTATPLILTQTTLQVRLPQTVPTLCLDTAWPLVATQPISNMGLHTPAESLAYVMYTSGSTGQPKGVCVTLITYHQLNAQANQLAHYLQTQGVGPETLVGLCVVRSAALLVGILGILKAGGAYIPLDPAYPQERRTLIIAESGLALVVTQQPLLDRLPHNSGQSICIDRDWPMISQLSAENLRSSAQPTDLAYVIYTSDSTGAPQGRDGDAAGSGALDDSPFSRIHRAGRSLLATLLLCL